MKKYLVMLLAVIMLFSAAACSGAEPEPEAGTGSESTDNTAAADTPADSGAKEPITFSVFINHTWYPVEDFTGIIPEEITKRTGVKLEPTIAVDDRQLGVMSASGELPDLVYTQTMLDKLSDPNLCHSYEDLIKEYNVEWAITPKQLGIARGFSKDGKAYTILNHYSEKSDWANSNAVPMLGSLVYRKDLWEKLGKPPMKSFDDLYAMMEKSKQTFPDVVPLKLNQTWNTVTLRFLAGMGNLQFIEQDNGNYIHYTKDPRYQNLLKWLNKCYQAGFISPDDSYFVPGSTTIPVDKCLFSCACTQNGIPGTNAELAAIDPSYVMAEMVPFEESSYITSDLGWSGTFITKNNKNPEAAIKFIAWMFTPEAQALTQMGREGTEYTLNEKGLPVFSDEWKNAIANNTHNSAYNPWFYFGGSEIVEANSRCATLDPSLVADAYKVMRERFDNLPWIMGALPMGETDEKIILDKIGELVKTYEAKIIMAPSETESTKLYNEYLSNASKTGMEKLESYITSRVKEIMPLYK